MANHTIMPDKDWDKFIEWLMSLFVTSSDAATFGSANDKEDKSQQLLNLTEGLWNKNIRDPKAFDLILNSYANIDTGKMTVESFQEVVNSGYTPGLQQYAAQNGYSLPPSQTVALAKLGMLKDKNYSDIIVSNYSAVKKDFDVTQQRSMIINQNLAGKTGAEFGALFDGLKSRVGLGVKKNLKDLDGVVNSKLADIEDLMTKDPAEIRAAMVQAGMTVTEATNAAIANMIRVAEQLNSEDKDRLFGDMRLRDIPKFENITGALSLDDSEERFKNVSYDTITGLLGFTKEASGFQKAISGIKDRIFGQTKDFFTEMKEKMERTNAARTEFFGIDPEDKDLTLQSISDYAYRSTVAVYSTDTYIAEPTQEQIDEELRLVFAYLYPTQDSEALLNKYKSMLTRGELGVAELLTKEEFGREDVYVTEEGKPSEGYVRAIESKTYEQLMGVTKIGNSIRNGI